MRSVPQILFSADAIQTGDNGIGTKIWNTRYQGLIVSEGHKRRRGRWSGGGPFYVRKYSVLHGREVPHQYAWFGPTRILTLCGVNAPGIPYTNVPLASPSWDSVSKDTESYSVTGYNRTKPGAAVADVGVFLSELSHDGLPKLPLQSVFRGSFRGIPLRLLEQLKSFRSLGSEYLNVAFGWKPFVNDLRKMYNLWKTIDRRMADIVRNNGKGIRRRVRLIHDKTVSQDGTSYGYAFANVFSNVPNIFGGGTQYTVTTTEWTDVWFVAKYRYWIPDIGSSLWDAKARAALFGALPTPEAVWNALPWTWLIDWFGDVSDVLGYISPGAVDNLVAEYSFTMKHVTRQIVAQAYCWHPPKNAQPFASWEGFEGTFSSTYVEETKSRVVGINPFGGKVSAALTPYQTSLLAALGMSRSSF